MYSWERKSIRRRLIPSARVFGRTKTKLSFKCFDLIFIDFGSTVKIEREWFSLRKCRNTAVRFLTLYVPSMDSMDIVYSIIHLICYTFSQNGVLFRFLSALQWTLHTWLKFAEEEKQNLKFHSTGKLDPLTKTTQNRNSTYSMSVLIMMASSLCFSAPATIWQINNWAQLNGSLSNIRFQSMTNWSTLNT